MESNPTTENQTAAPVVETPAETVTPTPENVESTA